MSLQFDTSLWSALRQARQRQRLVGKISAFLLAVALIGLMDGLLALMRTDSAQVELLPAQSATFSGPSSLKNPLSSDVVVRFTPEDAPLHFNLEGFFTGYWFGNGMWRGEVRAEQQAEPGKYEMRLSFKGATAQAAQKFILVVWADEAAQRAGSASYFRRFFGWNSFILAACFGGLGIACGGGTYLYGRRYYRFLAKLGYSEVFRVSQYGAPLHIWCLAGRGKKLQPGDVHMVLDADGQPVGEARVEGLQKGAFELIMLDDVAVPLGGLVSLRPVKAVAACRPSGHAL